MLGKLLVFLGVATAAFAQQNVSNADLPSSWVGATSRYNSSSSPKYSSGITVAILADRAQGLYSYSTQDISFLRSTPATSTRTGLAALLRSFGKLRIFGLVTAGETNTTSNLTGSFAGGFEATYSWHGFTLAGGYEQVSNLGKTYNAGIGVSFP